MEINQSLFVLNISQHRRCCFPAPFFSFRSCSFSNFFAEFLILKLSKTFNESINIARRNKETIYFVMDDRRDTTSLGTDNGYLTSHCLQHNKAKGFGVTGHHEHICRRKCSTKIIATHLSCKDSVGSLEMFIQLLLLRALTNNAKTSIRNSFQHGLDVFQTLFSTKTSYIYHEEVIRISICHFVSHFFTFEFGIESDSINTLAPYIDTRDAISNQFIAQLWTGTQGQIRT
mmetsp:Transcript_16931/g.26242  ORF Transcript_16931/g.26242 Transcript_16931/m.26242 type:complete len:230 (+) Transcript_16931:225-914(+)